MAHTLVNATNPITHLIRLSLTFSLDSQVTLNNGVIMPLVGYGTAGLAEGTGQGVAAALGAGYRHIDSAQV